LFFSPSWSDDLIVKTAQVFENLYGRELFRNELEEIPAVKGQISSRKASQCTSCSGYYLGVIAKIFFRARRGNTQRPGDNEAPGHINLRLNILLWMLWYPRLYDLLSGGVLQDLSSCVPPDEPVWRFPLHGELSQMHKVVATRTQHNAIVLHVLPSGP